MKPIRHILADQKGAYFLMSALVLSVMVGFAALGVEVGRWYAIQAEISKSIDGAAFAGAKNIANPKFSTAVALQAFAVEVAQANYANSRFNSDMPAFSALLNNQGQVTVTGDVNSVNSLTTVFDAGTHTTALGSTGSAQLRRAEVALVLDVSGSMNNGNALNDLKTGAKLFVENFQSFQKDHEFALITFAAGVQTPFPMDTDFAFDMNHEIGGLTAAGGTNTEDALGQAVNLPWTPDQSTVAVNQRIQQVVILFSDGNPSAFRANFRYNGAELDAVALLNGNNPPTAVWSQLATNDEKANYFTNNADRTGDGKPTGSTVCTKNGNKIRTTKWYIFDDPTYGINASGSPIMGYSDPYCNSSISPSGDLLTYTDWLVRKMAVDHAAQLKANGITVYTIGLGGQGPVSEAFLESLAKDSDHAHFTTDSAALEGIFQTIANELKLILVS